MTMRVSDVQVDPGFTKELLMDMDMPTEESFIEVVDGEGAGLIVVRSEHLEDWWTIQLASHENRHWMEPTTYGAKLMYSGRISDADVEGTAEEMLAIAAAIETGQSVSFRRCSAEYSLNGYFFESPRNSQRAGFASMPVAKALAADIRAKVGRPALEGAK